MIKINRLAASSAAAVLMASLILGGCSKKDKAETAEETTAQTESAAEGETADTTAQMALDEEKINALDPKKPESMGKINKLEYKGLSFESLKEEEVTDETVEEYLTDNILPYLPVTAKDGVIKEGDTANINYVGMLDGEEFDGGSAEGYDLSIGSGTFIDGFEDGLIGKKVGETVTLDLTFPEDYGNEELNGKAVVFTVDINSVKRTVEPDELDDAAAKELSEQILGREVATVDELKSEIKSELKKSAMLVAKSTLYSNAIAAAMEKSDVEPSEETITWQIDSALKSYNKSLQTQGFGLASYLNMMGTNYDDFRAELQSDAAEAAKEVMLRYAICEKEGLSFNEQTKKQYLEEFGYTEEDFDEYADEAEQQEAVIWYLAGKTIADNANVTYVEETEAETVADATDAAETETSQEESESETQAE